MALSLRAKNSRWHWLFSVHFSKMADQNIKRDAFKHEKMANQHGNIFPFFVCISEFRGAAHKMVSCNSLYECKPIV